MAIVVDTSALLAVIFDEAATDWVLDQFEANRDGLLMSTVNLSECLILIRDRRADQVDALEKRLLGSALKFVPPDVEQARQVAIARQRFPLNLGDCFAYALALSEDCAILTLDGDFKKCDRAVLMPPG